MTVQFWAVAEVNVTDLRPPAFAGYTEAAFPLPPRGYTTLFGWRLLSLWEGAGFLFSLFPRSITHSPELRRALRKCRGALCG
jgi:hypothetical protein